MLKCQGSVSLVQGVCLSCEGSVLAIMLFYWPSLALVLSAVVILFCFCHVSIGQLTLHCFALFLKQVIPLTFLQM